MFSPIYGLSLSLTASGDWQPDAQKGVPGGGAGYGGYYSNPLGGSFIDTFKKDAQLSPTRLIQELVGIAYACADLNASAMASMRLRLYVRTESGEKKSRWKTRGLTPTQRVRLRYSCKASAGNTTTLNGEDSDVEEVTDQDHPLLMLLRRPEPIEDDLGLSAFDHRYMTQLYLESLGRAYWYIGERDALGNPKYLRLLRSHLMREIPDLSGDRILAYYEYGGPNGDRFRPDEIVKFHFPDPYHPHLGGYGPLMAGLEKIRIGRKEDAHINALLDNMGRPDAIWSPKGNSEGDGIGTQEAQRVRSAFRSAFAQAGRGGLLVSEVPGQLEVLGWKPQDIVELERAKSIKTDICNVFGVPDAKLERNAANLASAKTADEAHARDTIYPRCTRTEEVINNRIVPLFDDSGRLFVAYDSPIPDDEVFQLELAKASAELALNTVDEGRISMGLAPLNNDLGRSRIVSNTMVLLGEDGKITPLAPPPPKPSTSPADAAKKRLQAIIDAGSL